ncbi:hypothetical protein LWI29_000051 [Acer saccharum]|uniref:Disease resistance protein At4g27190-like leucine-rich repeats domain-containing protein n=1 Tax=Acer saccharum TaxID=4024 RepID=A0AA39VZK4_ACESA|nr:hypothetical protein LWI29_000051 [Acer saccharum]
MRLTEWPRHQGLEQCTAISLMGNRIKVLPDGLVCPKLKILLLDGYYDVKVSNGFFEEMKTLKVASLRWVDLSVKSLQFLTNLVTLQLIECRVSDISSIKKLAQVEILSLKGSEIVELPEELEELNKLRMLDITDCRKLKRIPANVIPRLSRLEELYSGSYNWFKAWEVEGTSVEQSNASLSELSKLDFLTILSLCINVQPLLPKDFVLPTKLLRYCVTVNDESGAVSYPKSRILKIRGIEATSLVAFKALCEKSGVEYLELREIKGCCQNMVPSIDETGLNELKRLDLSYFDELECIIDSTQQQDVAFSNLVDLSLDTVGLREICSGGRPPRGFLENLETLEVLFCHSMSSLFPSWVLIQRLRKLKKVTVRYCDELEDVFQLEGLSYAKKNPFLLSSLESLNLFDLENLRYIWKGPTQQVSLQSLTVVNVEWCNKLRYLFTLSLARSLLQLEELRVENCGSLEHIVEIKEAEENVAADHLQSPLFFPNLICWYDKLEQIFIEEYNPHLRFFPNLSRISIWRCDKLKSMFSVSMANLLSLQNLKNLSVSHCNRLRHMFSPSLARNLLQLEKLSIESCGELEYIVSIKEVEENVGNEGGGGGNDVMFPKLRILELRELENFINFYSENSSLNMQTAKEQLRDVNLLRHGLQNLEELKIGGCRVQVLFQLEGVKQELSFPSLKVLELYYLEELECLCKGPTHLLSLPNLKKLTVENCYRLRHMFSPSLARNLLQLEELIIENCGELEYIVSIKAGENVGRGGGNDVMLPKLRILKLHGLPNFIDFYLKNLSLGVQTTKKQLRGLRHGLPNLEELYIKGCRVQVLFHLEGFEQELTFPSLKELKLYDLEELECLCKGPIHLLSLQNLTTLQLDNCHGLTHLFSSTTLVRNLLQLKTIDIKDCRELEQIIVEEHIEDDHVQLGLFPNLFSITVTRCGKLKSLFPVSMAHLLSLQNLTTLKLDDCHGLTHLFLSTLARNLLQLESIHIWNCGELEQITVEDHTEDDHVQLGLFPNLSSISINGCGKLKTLSPIVTIKTLQKLKTINIGRSFQLEELFGHKDEADMTSHREMVLPQLQKLTLVELPSLVNFCLVGYHFIFPSLSELLVTKCPKLTTRFSVDQNRSVHAEAEAPQTGKEDVDMEQSSLETTKEIECWDFDDLQSQLPPYIGK